MRLCILVGVCSRLNLFTGSNLGAVSLVTVNGLISAPFHSTGILSGPSHKFLFCFVLFCFLPHLFFLLSSLFLKRCGEWSGERHFLKIISWFFFALFTFKTQKYGLQSLMNWMCRNKCLHSDLNWTFTKAWVSHITAFSIYNMPLNWRRFRMTSFLEKHRDEYYFKSQQNFAAKFF